MFMRAGSNRELAGSRRRLQFVRSAFCRHPGGQPLARSDLNKALPSHIGHFLISAFISMAPTSQAALINLDTFSNAGELLARNAPRKTFPRCQVLTSRQDVYANQDTDQDFRFFQVPVLAMSTFVNMQAGSLQASTFFNTPGSEVRSLVRTLYARSDVR